MVQRLLLRRRLVRDRQVRHLPGGSYADVLLLLREIEVRMGVRSDSDRYDDQTVSRHAVPAVLPDIRREGRMEGGLQGYGDICHCFLGDSGPGDDPGTGYDLHIPGLSRRPSASDRIRCGIVHLSAVDARAHHGHHNIGKGSR